MKNAWRKKPGFYLCFLALIGLALFLFMCKKEQTGGEVKPLPSGGAETEMQLSRLTGDLLSQQEKIRLEPQNADLRVQLLTLAVDRSRNIARAAGFGKIPPEAVNLTMATQGAERAAFIDACRWIAYLSAWNQNPQIPDFGRIQGNVPPAKIIYKHAAPDQVVVLVEAEI